MIFEMPCERCGGSYFSVGVEIHSPRVTQKLVKCAQCGLTQKGAIVNWDSFTVKRVETDYPDLADYDDIRVIGEA